MADGKKQSDTPQPPPGGEVAAKQEQPPVIYGHDERACCCDELEVLLDQVECIHKTSTLGVSATDDEIQLTAIYTQPNSAPRSTKWPQYRDTYGFGNHSKTGTPLRFHLASFYPNHHCKLIGQLDVMLWRIKLTGDIVPVIQKVLGEAAVKFAPPGLSSVSDSLQKLIDDIVKKSGFGEHLVGLPISLPLNIDFSCGAPSLGQRLSDGLGPMTEKDADTCTLVQEVTDGDGADYKVTLRFHRLCDPHK